jgi:ubiquinone/menaquinone biosynthesis C-methylase UbiE
MSDDFLPNMPTMDSKHKQAVCTAFGALAPFYDAWYQTPVGKYVWAVESATITAMLPNHRRGIIFDIGTGTGMSLTLLSSRSTQIIGIDFAWEMLDVAYQKSHHFTRVHLVLADAENLPFRHAVADLVFGMTVLEFVSDTNQFLQEIYYSLSPNGWLVLGVLSSTNLWALERRIRSFVKPDVFSFAWFPSPWQVTRALLRNGFFKIQYQGAVYAPSFTPSKLLEACAVIDRKLSHQWLWRALGAFLVIRAHTVR